MNIKRLPAGFVIPAQPVKASKPPVDTEIPAGASLHSLKTGWKKKIRRHMARARNRKGFGWKRSVRNISGGAASVYDDRPEIAPLEEQGRTTRLQFAHTSRVRVRNPGIPSQSRTPPLTRMTVR
jgi:hypothetical protein